MDTEPPVGPVLCFGEVLWDCLPRGLFPGGAPVNVAYHLHQLGVPVRPVTAVGRDFLGEELLRRFQRWGLNREGVAVLESKPTGAVLVDLDPHGVPSYKILEDVAWDWIPLSPTIQETAARATALVYGSLAQRWEHNRLQLARLRQWASRGRQIFDVNLRAPFDSPELAWELARDADVIKLNEDELNRLLGPDAAEPALNAKARRFSEKSGCPKICVTAGAVGAGLWWDGTWYWEEARAVHVSDTIGAGDSFLAGLIAAWLDPTVEPARMLERACRLAEFVASRPGATPAYAAGLDGVIESRP